MVLGRNLLQKIGQSLPWPAGRFVSFRLRLALLFSITLTVIQAISGFLVYETTRKELVAQGERQLSSSSTTFARQLNDVSEHIAENVRVMALDFGLRTSIAQHDADTIYSALRNHGRRIQAERMLLINLDGNIEADTANPEDHASFPYPDLLEAASQGKSSDVVPIGATADWLVVVPVLAPTPIAYIAAQIPIDEKLLKELAETSGLPEAVELISLSKQQEWLVLPGTQKQKSVAAGLLLKSQTPPAQPVQVRVEGGDFIALASLLNRSDSKTPVMAVLSYSIDQAIHAYYGVFLAWAALNLIGLICALATTLVIARNVSRPIEQLAGAANRIARGEYWDFKYTPTNDEIGAFAKAFASMIEAIRDREGRISHQASHDAVSGLLNRTTIEEKVRQALVGNQHMRGALIAIGLDGLPVTVKTLGHTVADRMVQWASESLLGMLDSEDSSILLARTSDAGFSVWVPKASVETAIELATRLLVPLAQPYQEADLVIDATPAAGIAVIPDHARDATQLLQKSEVALQLAQRAQTPVVVYDQALDPHRPERLSLMADLREGLLKDGEFRLFFQPKLSLKDGTMESAEALIRWSHPKRGMIPPDAFISLAEETGNICALSRWVLAAGIKMVADWKAQGLAIRLALNLSARDLEDDSLPQHIIGLLEKYGLPTNAIVLEITESAVMSEPATAIAILNTLADRGIDLAIDDFGVGQSSFAYLRQLPVRELKIDQAFIRSMANSPQDQLIVRSIVELGHNLDYRLTAEGVENAASLDYLKSIGCDYAQGYFIAKPLPAEEFVRFVRTR